MIHGASALTVEHDPTTGKIILTASTCEELRAEIAALNQWRISRKEAPNHLRINCLENPSLKSTDISNLIPSHLKHFYGSYPKCAGPNCFNMALIESQLSKRQRYTDPTEWQQRLTEGCQLRDTHALPQPGDLVAIRKKTSPTTFEEIHGFTYLGGLGCSKNGAGTDSACLIQPIDQVFKTYATGHQPGCKNPSKIPPDDCEVFFSYYNCDTNVNKENKVLDAHFDKLESLVSTCVTTGEVINLDEILKALEEIRVALKETPNKKSDLTPILRSYQNQIEILRVRQLETKVDDQKKWDTVYPLHAAIRENDISRIKSLIDKKTALNALDPNGRTPLQMAAALGQLDTVGALLTAGADLEVKSSDGETALTLAVEQAHLEVVRTLLKVKADCNAINKNGDTALAVAVRDGNLRMARVLIQSKANPFLGKEPLTKLAGENSNSDSIISLINKYEAIYRRTNSK
jgi:hypothetical protein